MGMSVLERKEPGDRMRYIFGVEEIPAEINRVATEGAPDDVMSYTLFMMPRIGIDMHRIINQDNIFLKIFPGSTSHFIKCANLMFYKALVLSFGENNVSSRRTVIAIITSYLEYLTEKDVQIYNTFYECAKALAERMGRNAVSSHYFSVPDFQSWAQSNYEIFMATFYHITIGHPFKPLRHMFDAERIYRVLELKTIFGTETIPDDGTITSMKGFGKKNAN